MIKARKVGDISVNELKNIIKETFYEIIDPDHDSEISPEVKKELSGSLRSKERIPMDEVAERLGLVEVLKGQSTSYYKPTNAGANIFSA